MIGNKCTVEKKNTLNLLNILTKTHQKYQSKADTFQIERPTCCRINHTGGT